MATMKPRNPGAAGGLVYSTDGGRMCPDCRRPVAQCACRQAGTAPPAGDGIVRVSRQTKGRAGKGVTVVAGLALAPDALAELGKRLRTACGAGGTVKNGALEIQGDHCDAVIALLREQGFTVKRAGG
jgi:translation initiation factor 1